MMPIQADNFQLNKIAAPQPWQAIAQRFCSIGDYLAELNEWAEAMFSRLVKQLSEKEGVTEALNVENQMLWVQRMNNIRSAAMEIVSSELIYC